MFKKTVDGQRRKRGDYLKSREKKRIDSISEGGGDGVRVAEFW